ncbi:MAG: substrate-binding domain-containing protein [Acidobacteria bacterium]|nr:substrate-binding domain-containing protein [Acidobacteriota bacterium]
MTQSQKRGYKKEGASRAAGVDGAEFSRVRSADRTLDLLELLAARGAGAGFNEIADALELPRSSLSTLLRTLTTRRYVTRTSDGKRFRLGQKVLDLSAGYRHDGNRLDAAVQAMRNLARQTGEAAQVAVLDGAEAVYVAAESGPRTLLAAVPPGRRIPARSTAIGRCLLAGLNEEELDALFGEKPEQPAPRASGPTFDLKRELDQVRRLGFAYDVEESVAGLHCVAAPVNDASGRTLAALAVLIPQSQFEEGQLAQLPALVMAAAREASEESQNRPEAGKRAPTGVWRPRRVKIAWSMATFRVQAYQIIYRTVERICAEMGADVIWTHAKEDDVKQSVDVASLLSERPDVILIHPVHTVIADQLFARVEQAGVPAIAFQRPPRSMHVEFFVGGSTYQQGRITMAAVASALKGEGGVAMIQGDPYEDNARNLAQGVYDELAAHRGMRLVADQASPSWSADKARRIAEQMLEEHAREIKAFIVGNDDMAGTVAEALASRRLTRKVILVGGDGDMLALERIRAGQQYGTAFQDWVELARGALRFAISVARGEVIRHQLQRRRVLYNPPGAPVFVRDMPYTFVDRTNLNVLEQFWNKALSQGLPDAARSAES